MTVLQIPNGQQYFADNNGLPLAFGTVEMYVPGTLILKATWQDQNQSSLNTNPINLDGAGRCTIWGDGEYRQIVKDSLANIIWDKVVSAGNGQDVYWGGLSGGAPNNQTLSVAGFSFQDGATIQWIALFTNTSALTVTVNGNDYSLYANSQSGVAPLTGGEIIAGNIVTMVADTTLGGFRLTSGTANIRNLNVLGTFVRSGELTIAPLGANINDFAPPGIENVSVLRIASSIPINWSGLNVPALDGTYYTVDNYGTQIITMLAQSGLSSPGNQFIMPSDLTLNPNTSVEIHYDGTSAGWRIIGASAGARVRLLANRTYYVSTTGSDSNDGLAASRPFLTIQKAFNVVMGLDFNGFVITIQLADGTYTAGGVLQACVGQRLTADLTIQGNTGVPANVIVSTTTDCFLVQSGAKCFMTGMEFRSSANNGIYALDRANVDLGVVRFGTCASDHVHAERYAEVKFTQNYTISGSASTHLSVFDHAMVAYNGALTVTLTGTPNFTTAWASATLNAIAVISNGPTFSGAATGSRYRAANAGAIYVNGAGISYLPGNAAGTGTDYQTSPFGWYH